MIERYQIPKRTSHPGLSSNPFSPGQRGLTPVPGGGFDHRWATLCATCHANQRFRGGLISASQPARRKPRRASLNAFGCSMLAAWPSSASTIESPIGAGTAQAAAGWGARTRSLVLWRGHGAPRGLDLDLKVTTDGAAGRENEDRERDILISARVRSLHAGLLGVGLGGDATFVQLSSSPDGLPPERRRRGLARPRPGPPIFSM